MQQLIYDSDDFTVINALLPPYDTGVGLAAHTQPVRSAAALDDEGGQGVVAGFLMSSQNRDAQQVQRPIAPGQIERIGFEILDKRSGREVYLDGAWAELFQQKLDEYKGRMVTASELEEMLEDYSALATCPVHVH